MQARSLETLGDKDYEKKEEKEQCKGGVYITDFTGAGVFGSMEAEKHQFQGAAAKTGNSG